jgi:hypothetical protein
VSNSYDSRIHSTVFSTTPPGVAGAAAAAPPTAAGGDEAAPAPPPARPRMPSEPILDVLRRRNALDIVLYEWARNRTLTALARYGDEA